MAKYRYLLWTLWLLLRYTLYSYLVLVFVHSPIRRRTLMAHNTHNTATRMLDSFRIKLTVHNPEKLQGLAQRNYLAISNHTSYLDIIMLASMENFVFITSEEMGKSPFLGTITKLGGCLYTNRKKYVSLPKEIERFSATISQGFKVMLFPEGTSTNGDTVKSFRSSLFQTALSASCPILPMCIRYLSIDGQPLSPENRDTIYWYGDMTFVPHYMKLLGRQIEAEIYILDPLMHVKGISRRELSDSIHAQILSAYQS